MKIRLKYLIFCLVAILMLPMCEKPTPEKPNGNEEIVDPDPETPIRETMFDGTYYHDLPFEGWETETKLRADLMKDVKWTPLAPIQKSGTSKSDVFKTGTEYVGIPYSDGGPTMGFVGRDVSFHTFLSAVNNPKSYLYTTPTVNANGRRYPYFGSTCSATVEFIWGLPSIVATAVIYKNRAPTIIKRKESQDLKDLQLFDGFCYYTDKSNEGHIFMVYDIARDKEGNIKEIVTLEEQTPIIKMTKYTPATLRNRIDKISVPVYIYQLSQKYILPDFMEKNLNEIDMNFPDALCPARGNKSIFAFGKDVEINILSEDYESIELYRNDVLIQTNKISGETMKYSYLAAGDYKARLIGTSKASSFTYFEVCSLSYTVKLEGRRLYINCPAGTTPSFMTINDDAIIHALPFKRTASGKWYYDGDLGNATTCRVRFAGRYGTYMANSVSIK